MEKIKELIESYFYYYNEYIENTIDYPDLAEGDYKSFAFIEEEIIDFFKLKNNKSAKRILYGFVKNSCHENQIILTCEICSNILKTMEKLTQIHAVENDFDKFFKSKLKEMIDLEPVVKENLPNSPGIYVFYKSGEPIYVGRTDNIRKRIQMHLRPSSKRDTATFAFNLAKIDYFERYGNHKISRATLEKNEEFNQLFIEKKCYLSTCVFKFIIIENDILQTMLEPYIAYKLGTYPILNIFDNH
jgi:predicted GIY-YIG superfamily endonuclease